MNTEERQQMESLKAALGEAIAEAHYLAYHLHQNGIKSRYEDTDHDHDTKWTKCRSENCAEARTLLGIRDMCQQDF